MIVASTPKTVTRGADAKITDTVIDHLQKLKKRLETFALFT